MIAFRRADRVASAYVVTDPNHDIRIWVNGSQLPTPRGLKRALPFERSDADS